MSTLCSMYDDAKPSNKLPFDIGSITEALTSEPLNMDISQIVYTPQTVIVKKTRDEYLNEKIATIIKNKFDVNVSCRSDMLVFS